jgi:glucan biosynthesis protein C
MLFFFNSYRLSYSETATVALKAGHAFVHAFFCLAAVFWLLAVFQTYFDRKGTVLQPFNRHSYSIYYVHQLVVLPIAYLVQKLAVSVWLKYFAVSFAAMIICLLAASIFDHLIGVFNLRSKAVPDEKF